MGQTDPCRLADGGEVDLAADAGVGITDDHADEDVETSEQTLEQHRDEQHGEQGDDGGVGGLLEIVPHAGGQVEADDGHDGTVDDRRHDDVDPFGSGVMHQDADQRQQQTGDHDAEGRDGDALVRGGDRRDRGDESEGGSQIARQHVLVDQQEQRGRHGREEQGGGRVETGQNRHQERGAEHGDDMLRTDFRGARPGQALVGFDDLAGLQRFAVAVELPREQARDGVGHAIVSLTLPRGVTKRAARHRPL